VVCCCVLLLGLLCLCVARCGGGGDCCCFLLFVLLVLLLPLRCCCLATVASVFDIVGVVPLLCLFVCWSVCLLVGGCLCVVLSLLWFLFSLFVFGAVVGYHERDFF
jgi:hypothetical protein